MINRSFLSAILLTFFSCTDSSILSYEILGDKIIINDKDSFGLYDARHFNPIMIISDNNLFIYDGNFFIVKYEGKKEVFKDTLRLPKNTKIQPLFEEIDDEYIVFIIGLERFIISKSNLNDTFEPYKVICSYYENENYDTYDFEIEKIRIDGDSVECFLDGNVRDKSIKLLWGTKELDILE